MHKCVLITSLSNKLGIVNLSPVPFFPVLWKKYFKQKNYRKLHSMIKIFPNFHFKLATESHSSFKGYAAKS